jgi:hypothetical protein
VMAGIGEKTSSGDTVTEGFWCSQRPRWLHLSPETCTDVQGLISTKQPNGRRAAALSTVIHEAAALPPDRKRGADELLRGAARAAIRPPARHERRPAARIWARSPAAMSVATPPPTTGTRAIAGTAVPGTCIRPPATSVCR